MEILKTESAARLITALAVCLLTALSAPGRGRDADAAKQAALGNSPEMVEEKPPRKLPDLTKGERIPVPPKGGIPKWQMGPTGIIGLKNGKNSGDQIRVAAVMAGSPLDGKVLPGDVLLGVQGKDFVLGGDLNRTIGNAIIEAETEAGGGDFTIHIWRDRNWVKRSSAKDVFNVDLDTMFKEAESGADIYEWEDEEERSESVEQVAYDEFPIDGFHTNIAFKLEVMGTYSDTSPWDCPVVQKVRDNALKVIAARMQPKGRHRGRGGSWPDVLALVASGKPEYVKLARAWVHQQKLCQDMDLDVPFKEGGYQSWHHGFGPLEMAIYHDATGDDYVLPEIRKQAVEVALGQNGGGSWGHTFASPRFNGGMLHKCNPGYGAMNNAGTRCFFLLTLAKKAGIEHPEINAAIWRAGRFFRTFVDKGCIPYGYHSPYPSDDSNGKNYGAAYAFYVLGKKYEAKYFSMHSANASFTRRGGHGSPTLWYYTPLSAHIAGPRAVQAYMRNMRYFYTLSRRHDGSFIFMGEQPPGIGGKGMRNATATMVLHMSRPLEQLVITGKDADPNFWMTDEEYEELLISAHGIKDPKLLAEMGTPWKERGTDDVIELLDAYYPKYRGYIASEVARRYKAGEKDILPTLVAKLSDPEPRMRAGACQAISGCGADAVLAHLSTFVKMLKDDAEFVRMQASKTIGGATQPGEEKREVVLLKATVDDYPGMTMDNGNVRNAVKGILFQRKRRGSKDPDMGKLATSPFQAGYDEDLVRLAMEKIVTMDPQGTVPGTWDREALLKLAGPVTFAAEERQVNDAMFGGARKSQGQALLRKHGYREAVEGEMFNLIQRSFLPRARRRGVRYKDGFIGPSGIKRAPGLYRDYLDQLYLWQLDNPLLTLSEKTGKGKPPIVTPLYLLIEIIEKDTDTRPLSSIRPDVQRMFQGELEAAGGSDAQLALCRTELADLDRRNYFRKMYAMSHLVETLGGEAINDVSAFLGHQHWRLREHAGQLAAALMEGETPSSRVVGRRLVERYEEAQARESGLMGNWNAAGILKALGVARHEPALDVARRAFKHHDPLVRGAAVQAVFAIGGDRELDTVFDFMRKATDPEDFNGAERALLSKSADAKHVARVSEKAIALLPKSAAPARRSLAWVLGQFGGEANLAAIYEAAATTEDNADLREMAMALAYSPDRAASEHIVELVKGGKRIRDVVAPLSLHRMVGRNGMGDVTDAERVRVARGVLNMIYQDGLVRFLGRVHTGLAMQLLYDVMKMNPSTAAKSIIECAEGIRRPTPLDRQLASDVLANVVEYIEVTHLRGGMTKQVRDWRQAGTYMMWKGLQARAGEALLRFHDPKSAAIPEFEDVELDL